jgi:hypothetical protein
MSDAAKAAATPEEIEIETAEGVKMESIDWLWDKRFALGKLGLIGGNPERGKGLIYCDMVSRITRGAPWPCNEGKAEEGHCIIMQQEDDLADTVVPRLAAAGAVLAKVTLVKMIKKMDGSSQRVLDLAHDIPKLRELLDRLEGDNPLLLVIDPLMAYIGRLNASSGNEVRSALAPLVDMLKHFHIAGLGIMHFNKKIDVDNALARISDSVAFGALARHCFVATDDPENERRLLVKAKNNLAPDVKALSYTIRALHAGADHRDGRAIYAPRIEWGYEHVEVSAAQAMRAENNGKAAVSATQSAKDFLERTVKDEPIPQTEIEEAMQGEPFKMRTLHQVKKDLGIESKRINGKWCWQRVNGAATGEAY